MGGDKGTLLFAETVVHQGKDYLQLGSGSDHITVSNKAAEAWIDVRFPLRFTDNTCRGVYAHHVVEHISYTD